MSKENTSGVSRKRPGKGKLVLASIVLVAVGGACLLGFTQRNNIKALYMVATADPAKLEEQLASQEQRRDQLLEEYGLTAPTRGNAAGSDAVPEVGPTDPSGETVPAGQPEQNVEKPSENSSAGTETPAQPAKAGELDQQAKEKLQGYVNELYALEDQYLAKLDGIIQTTKEEFWALPKEQWTRENKIALVKSKAQTLIAEEKQCDAAVEGVLSKIQTLLDENKVKNNLVSEIRARYEDSKATWKAARMTELYQ